MDLVPRSAQGRASLDEADEGVDMIRRRRATIYHRIVSRHDRKIAGHLGTFSVRDRLVSRRVFDRHGPNRDGDDFIRPDNLNRQRRSTVNDPRTTMDAEFAHRLIAIAESDSPEDVRIKKTSDLCAAYVTEAKRRHRIDPRQRPTEHERAILEREVAAVREAILQREAVLPGASATRRILKAARLAVELDSRGTNVMGQILKDELINRSGVPAGV